MIWSIDFQVTGSGSGRGSISRSFGVTPAQCTGPYQLVLPPRALPSKTTISIPPYTTSLEVAPGTTKTVTVKIPPIVTESMDYYNVRITSGQGQEGFRPTPSINIKPITTTLTLDGGSAQVRTLYLPPWPKIVGGTIAPGEPVATKTSGPRPDSFLLTGTPQEDNPPEPTFEPISKPPYDEDEDPTTTWPSSWEIKPLQTDVSEKGEDDDGDGPKSKTTCKLWFFWVCISWPEFDISIKAWEWNIPPGILPPRASPANALTSGPPPIDKIKLPPGFTIKGTLPPWPKMTNAITHWAPGVGLYVAGRDDTIAATGSSFAAPLVAGLVAYIRSHPKVQALGIGTPALVKQIMDETKRKKSYFPQTDADREIVVWNSNPHSPPLVDNSCDSGAAAKRGLNARQFGGGNGEPAPSHLEGLPYLLTPTNDGGVPVSKVCLPSTTAVHCNGGRRGGVCQITTSCASTGVDPNFPTITVWQPPASPTGATCASSTTWTVRGGPRGQATITSSACASWTPKETPKPDPAPNPVPKRRCITAHT
ncbi:hypothetical protein ACHAO9_010555 [Fusarium lateritium]